MKFQKGQSGNPNGRPIGAKNKATAKIYKFTSEFIESNIERLQKDIDLLEPKDRVRFIASLLNYVLPKQQAIAPVVEDYTDPQRDIKISIIESREELQEIRKERAELEQIRADFEKDKELWLEENGYI